MNPTGCKGRACGICVRVCPEEVLRFGNEVVVGYGITARAAKAAVRRARELGLRVSLLRPRTLWPSPATVLCALARRVRAFVVAELNFGQWSREVERLVGRYAEVLTCAQADGTPLDSDTLLECILKVARAPSAGVTSRRTP